MLEGIQQKVDGEIQKGMNCLAQAKAELQVSPICATATCCMHRSSVVEQLHALYSSLVKYQTLLTPDSSFTKVFLINTRKVIAKADIKACTTPLHARFAKSLKKFELRLL